MAEMVKDVVCGMEVDPETAPAKSEHQGATYHFCSDGCKQQFDAEPQKYLGGGEAPAAEAGPSAAPGAEAPQKRWWEFWK